MHVAVTRTDRGASAKALRIPGGAATALWMRQVLSRGISWTLVANVNCAFASRAPLSRPKEIFRVATTFTDERLATQGVLASAMCKR